MELDLSIGRVVFAMSIGLIGLITLILKTKLHPFVALITAATTIGILLGVPLGNIGKIISGGFGGTLGSIGIIIGFGVMMGEIFEMSGAAARMAKTFIKVLGKGREELALSITGFLVSIPIFCDSAFVVLSPIVKAISKKTNKSVVSLGVALAVGLVVTHSLVPPTPGPVGVAGIFGVNVGTLLLWSLVLAVPATLLPLVYIKKVLDKKFFQVVNDSGEIIRSPYQRPRYLEDKEGDKNLPSTVNSFMPILLPIVLILVSTITKTRGIEAAWVPVVTFLGTPVIAVGLGMCWAILFLATRFSRKETIFRLDKSLSAAAVIIFVTGGGGALGAMLRESGAGDVIASAMVEANIPPIILPLIIATVVRFIQGSGTVSMITAASISAPILAGMNDVNMVFAALSACVGSLFFGYFNDSYFWVVNRTLGISETKEQIQVWSVTSTIAWGSAAVMLFIVNAVFG